MDEPTKEYFDSQIDKSLLALSSIDLAIELMIEVLTYGHKDTLTYCDKISGPTAVRYETGIEYLNKAHGKISYELSLLKKASAIRKV